jgi:hypothetical protein
MLFVPIKVIETWTGEALDALPAEDPLKSSISVVHLFWVVVFLKKADFTCSFNHCPLDSVLKQ